MIAVVVALALALVAVSAFAIQRAVALSKATARVVELDGRVSDLETELAAASNRADVADAKATKATAEAAAASKRADNADRDAKEATAAAERDAARASAEEARAVALATRVDAAEAALRLFPADGLWALETRRVARVWRDRVSVTLDGRSPLADATDAAEAGARVLADASREEAGVVVDLTWTFDGAPTGSERVMVVRVAEELIAAAWSSDGADLDVRGSDDGIELRLRAEPTIHADADLADALHACGAEVSFADGAVVVRLPRAADAVVPTAEA